MSLGTIIDIFNNWTSTKETYHIQQHMFAIN
jgi:hypothetical protein